MGIVNVTPDSFSDGGEFLDPDAAIAHGRELAAEGADLLDVGGESTRPGAQAVSVDDELARVPAGDRGPSPPAGASLSRSTPPSRPSPRRPWTPVRDGQRHDRASADPTLAGPRRRGCEVLPHAHARRPPDDAGRPRYEDVVDDIKAFLEERMEFAAGEGIGEDRHLDRLRDRLRQDGRAQPRAPAASGGVVGLGRPVVFGTLAQELHREAHRGRRRRSGLAGRSPRM